MTGKEGALSGGKWESNHSQETDGTWTWGSGGDRRSRSRRLRCLCPGERVEEDFLDRHQFQMVALALRRDGEESCLRDREREERSAGEERETEEWSWEGGE